MNQEERDWLEWLKRAQDEVVTQRQAAEKMGVSDRWVRTLLRRSSVGRPLHLGLGGKNEPRRRSRFEAAGRRSSTSSAAPNSP
jgi:hypothetical protein